MKIQSIRLHPFGGTLDRTIRFQDGINILEGPNEAGKSTLTNAIFHALFTPTDLTPARAKKLIGRWLPRPSGDHARVTLVYSVNGVKHTLIKTWGAKANAQLIIEGQPPMEDNRGVQALIEKALQWNEATWANILFINQAKLNSTLEALDQAENIEEVLRKPGTIDGDIAPEKLIAALEQRIAEKYGRWDRSYGRPEGGRGVDQRWKQGVGPVLEAWYVKEELSAQASEVMQHERDLDKVNSAIAAYREAIAKEQAFVQDGRERKDGLTRRTILEQALAHRKEKVAGLMQVLTEWPGADQVLKEKKESLARIDQELEKLKIEIANAKLHEGSETVRKGYEALQQARKAMEEASRSIAALKPVQQAEIDLLRKLNARIERLSVEIKAQKLAATLRSSEPLSVQITRGSDLAEHVHLEKDQPYECNAEGRISITVGALAINVRSDQKDVDQLYADLAKEEQQRTLMLERLQCKDLAELEARKLEHDAAQHRFEKETATYKACLRSKTEEEWQAAIEKLKLIPATRALIELEQENARLLNDQAALRHASAALIKKIEDWTVAYSTPAQLMQQVVELNSLSAKEESEFTSLPSLPAGFETTQEYLERLRSAEAKFEKASADLNKALIEQGTLHGRHFDSTAEELKEKHELAEKEFQRQLSEAKAYERILARVRSLADREGPDPFAGFNQRVEHFVQLLTDGRYRPQLQGVKAIGLHAHGNVLEHSLLSQGTQGCLALAVRMAYAEIYLGKSEGFMIMDDPLTDMDPSRRKCAVSAIKDFAQKYQVIVLTCHPEHAQIFRSEGAAYQALPYANSFAPTPA